MFTGIIEAQGTIKKLTKGNDVWQLLIEVPPNYLEDYIQLPIGSSVACSGACLTIIKQEADSFVVEITTETQACTNLGKVKIGTKINLERAMSATSTFDGHIVTGHIDGQAEIETLTKQGQEMMLTLCAPSELSQYIAAKGSVALDGASLTVNRVDGDRFDIMLIPHTLEVLGWHALEKGYCFNLEIDLLSRYVARYLQRRGL